MEKKQLGKIRSISIGYGGYQDAMFGVSFELGGEGWSTCDFWGGWTEENQANDMGLAFIRLAKLMSSVRISSVSKLTGLPVEIVFENGIQKSWRLLTEVL